MWGKVSELLGLGNESTTKANELHLATAALMVHVSLVDDNFTAEERSQLLENLQTRFHISQDDAEQILKDAEAEQKDTTCLYRFTKVITGELDQDGRQQIIKLLWQVAFADGHIDDFEKNIIAKVGGLLGVSAKDRIALKHEVEAA
ncbi:TerB family tellurite resistance protein [Kordiimonas sp. SCSIO 12610]|uniref:tellurite resistance TerB family protein n=1 Tax=Kordiimonas sp. SCSIO 12610 TaxID=2829597 RepID=UPI002109E73B|nr:TerB family tellurite resistance protein [Kordiimonas sp. SCSIO 12610]UTW54004.1 TerB family tellurite resistance protein [Kordiimonas sp. SCSIO 12610]